MEIYVKINGLYKNFKGHIYKVLLIAKDSETLKEKVVYQNIETNELWVRDYNDFLSLVDLKKYPDVKQKERFEEVKEKICC